MSLHDNQLYISIRRMITQRSSRSLRIPGKISAHRALIAVSRFATPARNSQVEGYLWCGARHPA